MGRWDRYSDHTELWKDILIVEQHPRYDGLTITEGLRQLYDQRNRRRPNYE